MTLVSEREFAKAAGVSQATIQRAVKSGRIQKTAGKIDLESQLAAFEQKADLSKDRGDCGHEDSDADSPDKPQVSQFQAAKARREDYTARLKELEYQKKSGQLIERSVVSRTLFRFCRMVRDGILNIPGRVAGELSALLVKHLETILNEHLPGKQVKEILESIDTLEIERMTFQAWEKESRTILDNLANGKPNLTDDADEEGT
jgi:phage terminase Nu1 subunit (DNA packaging protein)